MRYRVTLLLLAALLALPAVSAEPKTIVLTVQNMTCPVCPITVRRALLRVPGVLSAKVRLRDHTATVAYDPDRTEPAALVEATTNAGYPAKIAR